jgi:glycosyltransferase involved in cell wall biosynthesis
VGVLWIKWRTWKTTPDQELTAGRRPVVALVSDAIYPYFRGGKELRYHELSTRLSQRADVHVFTMKWWDGPAVRQEGHVTFHAASPLYPMYVGDRRSFREAIFFALGCMRLLWFRFDVLEADQFPNFHIFTLRVVAWIKRKPLTVTWHEVWDRDYWREYLGRVAPFAWFVEWLSMRLPDQLIAASDQTAVRLRAVLGDKASISVVPNGIDLGGIRNSYPDPAKVDLVTIGRFLPHKNMNVLLDSVALLRASGVPVTCRIIGDGPLREALHAQAQRLGIESVVDFRHDIWEQKDVYALMKAARVAVFPTTREGFGIAVLEAIACGLPVVTTSAPDNLAQYLVARSSAGVVCVPTAAAIADALRTMLAQLDDRPAEIPVAQDAWLADHSWDAAADRVGKALGLWEQDDSAISEDLSVRGDAAAGRRA